MKLSGVAIAGTKPKRPIGDTDSPCDNRSIFGFCITRIEQLNIATAREILLIKLADQTKMSCTIASSPKTH